MKKRENKIILDTNLWISFLISRQFSRLDNLIFNKKVKLVFSQELIDEFIQVASRPKFEKYFNPKDLEKLLELFDNYAIFIKVTSDIKICRDPKDNFLLSLARDSKADFLLTGDLDLLDLKKLGNTKIISINEFERLK